MSSWIKTRLGDVLNFRRGHDLPKYEMVSGSVPVAGSNGVIGLHNVATPISPCITIGRSGSVGRPYMYESCWAHNTVLYIDDYKGNNPKFIYYLLKSLNLENYGEGSAVPTLNRNHIHPLEISFPSDTVEQERIAGILSSLDDKIELLGNQNRTLEELAQTLFRHHFIENPNPDWVDVPLSSIAVFLNGLACQKYRPTNNIDKLPVLKIRELNSGISEDCDWATSNVKKDYIVENGDVIFSWSASLMMKIWNGETCVLNQHLFKVTSEKYPMWFYYMWSKYHLSEFIAIAESHATTMGHIKRADLDSAMVLTPSQSELDEMTQSFEPIFDKLKANNKQISSLTKLRGALLPKLMTNEIKI